MKLIFSFSCIAALLLQLPLYGQTNLVKEYVDENLYEAKQEEAKYFRIASVDKNNNMNGIAEYYYLNNDSYARNLFAKGKFEKNCRTGKWEWWYADGKSKEVGYFEKRPTFYEPKKAFSNESLDYTYRIESFWDSTGVQHVINGNGEALYTENGIVLGKGNYQNGLKQGEWKGAYLMSNDEGYMHFTESYNKGELVTGVSHDKNGKSYTYDVLEILPEPKGGINGLMRYLMKSLRYPIQARRKGIEGKAIVQFYVDKDGTISDVELLQGVGGGCDEEAIRVVKESPKWTAAVHRGQKVKVRMTLPIVFQLG